MSTVVKKGLMEGTVHNRTGSYPPDRLVLLLPFLPSTSNSVKRGAAIFRIEGHEDWLLIHGSWWVGSINNILCEVTTH